NMFISKRKTDGTDREYNFAYATTLGLFFRVLDWSAGSDRTITCDWSPSTGQWYHIAFTYNGSDGLLFIDGVEQESSTNDSGTYTAMANGDGTLMFGKVQNATTFSLDGYIDELSIFDIELSEGEVFDIYSKNEAGEYLTE